MEDQITLTRTSQCWLARFEGPQAVRIQELFGTTVLPTAFTAHAEPGTVQREIERLNPECRVLVE